MTTTDFSSVLPRLIPAPVPDLLKPLLSRAFGLEQAQRTYGALRSMDTTLPIGERLLTHMEVTTRVAESDLDNVPRKGAAIVVANHPFGILEGAVLAAMFSRRRADVRFLGNDILTFIPEINDLVIPVDPMGEASSVSFNSKGVRRALDFVAGGGLLVIFPAGEVSHFRWSSQCVTDPPWNPAAARIITLAARRDPALRVLPVYVRGRNSLMFQAAGMLCPGLRTALLARELVNKRRKQVEVRIGAPVQGERILALQDGQERMDYLRWRTYLLANRNDFKPRTSLPLRRLSGRAAKLAPLAKPVAPELLRADVAALSAADRLAESGSLSVFLTPAHRIPNVLREIGRLREVTFRAVGEGTGKPADLDRFDHHYQHLFVWNDEKAEVAGAYRLAPVEQTVRELGIDGLYTATLFHFDGRLLDKLGSAIELGRSFVRPEYQRAFAPLLLLWKGIGAYVAQNPHCKVLFGPVSISNAYPQLSRQLMISFLERRAGLSELMHLVRARNPLNAPFEGVPCRDVDELCDVVSDLEPGRQGVPVLLRQYLRLGGKLLGFNVDAEFANALDGLILVDLTRTDQKLLERYLGKQEAAEFLAYQKGQDGTL